MIKISIKLAFVGSCPSDMDRFKTVFLRQIERRLRENKLCDNEDGNSIERYTCNRFNYQLSCDRKLAIRQKRATADQVIVDIPVFVQRYLFCLFQLFFCYITLNDCPTEMCYYRSTLCCFYFCVFITFWLHLWETHTHTHTCTHTHAHTHTHTHTHTHIYIYIYTYRHTLSLSLSLSLCLYISLSVYLSLCLYISLCLSISLFHPRVSISLSLSISLFLSIHFSLSIHPYIHLSISFSPLIHPVLSHSLMLYTYHCFNSTVIRTLHCKPAG